MYARGEATETLTRVVGTIATAGDYGDMLGAVRLVEIAADQVRRAIVTEARAAGDTWQSIADALGVTRQAAHERFAPTSP
jgi:hypothetical protein